MVYALLSLTIGLAGCQGNSDNAAYDEIPVEMAGPGPGGPGGPPQLNPWDQITDHVSTAGYCVECHDGLTGPQSESIDMVQNWSTSMMANAAKDPLWQAKVESEVVRNPHLQSVLEETCAKCHTPMGVMEATITSQPISLSGDGFLNPNNALHNVSMDGVSCSVCHQIEDQNLGTKAASSGNFPYDQSTIRPNRNLYGPYTNPLSNTMVNATGFVPAYGPHIEESALCATCHDLFTPVVDTSGTPTGAEFAEQTPFLEWKESVYFSDPAQTKSCQDCHMPPVNGDMAISTLPTNSPLRPSASPHAFEGANQWMLGILAANRTTLGVNPSEAQLLSAQAASVDYLQNDSARLSIVSSQIVSGRLQVTLKVENITGHKLPTAYPSRRMWLRVTAADGSGTFFSSGEVDGVGKIVDNAADLMQGSFEPHYQTITSADQVQVYETLAKDSDGQITYGLLNAASHAKDNRMLPEGWNAATVDHVIEPVGGALSDADFIGGSDLITYDIDLGGRTGISFTADLLYQTASYAFLQDLYGDAAQSQAVSNFKTMADNQGNQPTLMKSVTANF